MYIPYNCITFSQWQKLMNANVQLLYAHKHTNIQTYNIYRCNIVRLFDCKYMLFGLCANHKTMSMWKNGVRMRMRMQFIKFVCKWDEVTNTNFYTAIFVCCFYMIILSFNFRVQESDSGLDRNRDHILAILLELLLVCQQKLYILSKWTAAEQLFNY